MELAGTFVCFLANRGEAFHLDEPVVTYAGPVCAMWRPAGCIQNAGEFARRVGLPAKSGVGGGIVAIVPHEMAIAVWVRSWICGKLSRVIAALERVTQTLGRSVC